MAVGDGVAECDDGCGARGCFHVDFGELEPVIDLVGVGQGGRGYCVAMDVPGSGSGSGMTGFPRGSGGKMEGYGEIGEGGEREGKRVRDKLCAGRDGYVGGTREG